MRNKEAAGTELGDCRNNKFVVVADIPRPGHIHSHLNCIVNRFVEHLDAMFSESPGWDTERKYHPDQLQVRT